MRFIFPWRRSQCKYK